MSKTILIWLCVVSFALLATAAEIKEKTGLVLCGDGAFEGYTLFTPLHSTDTYLVNMDGKVVHKWKDKYTPGQSQYLLKNGHLLRSANDSRSSGFHGGGIGGRIRELDWNGKLVWDYKYADDKRCQHHDIEPLPNGNVLILAWEKKFAEEVIGAGRDPSQLDDDELWPDHIVEVRRQGKTDGRIVWQWHAWDHLVQDFNPDVNNHGDVAAHPELIDINFGGDSMHLPPKELNRLRALGYVGGPAPKGRGPESADWLHGNSLSYNEELDQILISVHGFNEIWVIDHSTTTAESASHTGGRYGKGGDLLYRWGNPQAYRAGTAADQKLFGQHDATWVKSPSGETHILVFNNGRNRPDGDYSSVDEIVPPLRPDGSYSLESGAAYGPSQPVWQYTQSTKSDFFSSHISGAQRLPNGNTLVCAGEQGDFFEVNAQGATVWHYINPIEGNRPNGRPPRGNRRRSKGNDDNHDRAHPPRQGPRGPRGDRRGTGVDRGGTGVDRRGPNGVGRGPSEANAVFRATRIAADDPAIKSRKLSPKNSE
ncbi:MAG TPA: aryl-sulfate sulfotransferase [Phycisphaerae bacterium]|nr:aryl-sulfate sulfotransferase [Phycisphaerae bacterium]